MAGYGINNGGLMAPQPSNNLWVGNNYSANPYGGRMPNGQIPTTGGLAAQQVQPVNNVLQVMGPESAMAYQVGPNSSVILMDTNRKVFYTKRSDDSGYSETRAFEYREIPLMETHAEPVQTSNTEDFVTKEEMDKLKKQLGQHDYVSKKDFDSLKKLVEEMRSKDA